MSPPEIGFERPAQGPRFLRAAAGPRQGDVWVLTGLVLLAAVIRIVVIDNQSFWTDEALSVYEARSSFAAMWHLVMHVETTPPLFFVLTWGWAHVFGTSEIALRTISCLAGISLVPIAYLAARELASRRAGVLAAALVAVNPFMIWYSQEARAYMLLTAFSAAAFLWFLRARRDPSRRHLAWWAAFASLALMTHFFAGFTIAPEALWLLWCARRRPTVLAVGWVALVQLAMMPFALSDTGHGVGWVGDTGRLTRIAQTASQWWISELIRRTTVAEELVGGLALIAAVTALLIFGGDRRARAGARVGAAIAGFALLVPLALGFVGQDYFISRNVLPAFIPVVTVIACACTARRTRGLGLTLAVALLAIFSISAVYVQTHPFLQRPQWRALAQSLGGGTQPRAILAAGGTTADPLKIYLPGARWAQQRSRSFMIDEIDVIGARKRFKLRPASYGFSSLVRGRTILGSAMPTSVAPPGTRLIVRRRVHGWVIARFGLDQPAEVSTGQLQAIASSFFRRTPKSLLVFMQHARK